MGIEDHDTPVQSPIRSARVLTLHVNGEDHEVLAPDHWTLLEVLRYNSSPGRQGCDKGDYGACTVLVDGKATLACCALAAGRGPRGHHHRGRPPKLPRPSSAARCSAASASRA